MKDLERDKIIQYFNYNITLEHSAIIQYLFHAYTIGDAETENELEEIAREEMKHLRMFAHKVVELGGKPAIFERAAVFLTAPTFEELMQLNIDAELMAMQEYSRQREDINDEASKRILTRAIEDETAHSIIFKKMKENISNLSKNRSSYIDENMANVVELLNSILQKQYQKILEYLFESFITRHKNHILSDELEQKAIDQMKHFGWIAEEISERGFNIDVKLPKAKPTEDINQVAENIAKQELTSKEELLNLSKEVENLDLKWILERIANREIHYVDLKKFIENNTVDEKVASEIIKAFTVGSLFKKG